MNIPEIETALEHITLIIDTREHQTEALNKRIAETGLPFRREKLDVGDYSAVITTEIGDISLAQRFAIERKMSIEELTSCFCQQRQRFEREFQRAKKSGTKIYLLIENCTYEKIINGSYKTQMHPNALLASLFAFLARYDCQAVFCLPKTTGRIIGEIVRREAYEELLTHLDKENDGENNA
jgi:ERCC4-type nuclease